MKKAFTKVRYCIAVIILISATALSARAQFISSTVSSNAWVSAATTDANGNVYVVEAVTHTGTNDYGKVVMYPKGSGNPTIIYSGGALPFDDQYGDTDRFPFGIAVTGNGDIYVTTAFDYNSNYGGIIKLAYNSANGTYTESPFFAGTQGFASITALAVDAGNNLYCLLYDQSGDNDAGSYEINEFPTTAGIPQAANITQIFAGDRLHLYVNALNSSDTYSNLTGLAVDPSGNIYVADAFDISNPATDGGHVYKLTKSGSSYTTSTYTTGQYTSALASDASGNIYANNGSASSKAYSLVEYPGGSTTAAQTLYTGLTAGGHEDFLPTAIAPVSSTDIFVNNGTTGGTDQGDLYQLFGPPATQASGISFSNTALSSTNISWTAGSGTRRMVFIEAGTTGTPTITNGTTYNANPQFGSGSTAGSGWYCVYNSSGTSVTVNGLQRETAYTVMVVEQNGQNYLTTAVQGSNINTFTTQSYTIVTTSAPSALTSIAGTTVPVTSFNITCTNITTLVADAPAGFDVSFDDYGWSVQGGQIFETLGEIPIGDSLIVNATIYVRLDAADAPGNYSGNIILKDAAGILSVNQAIPLSTVLSNTPTTVTITAANAYSNAGSIQFAVTFGSPVIGLTPSNFSLTTTGMVSGASVSSVSGSGSGYTVTVNTGMGDGAIGLNLDNNTGFAPTISTSLPFAGGTTVIDKTPPTISISSPSVSSIVPGSGQVTYTVTYADANFNTSTLSTSDITLNTNGKVNGTVTLTGSGTSYTVTISNIVGNGTLGISIDAGTATDLAGNAALASDPSATFTVSPPVISAMGKLSPLSAIVGSASSSENFDVSGSNLSGDITVTAPIGFDISPDNSVWSGSGGSFTVTPSSSTISATVFVRLDASDIVNTYSGNVALTGGGASEADMSIPPSTVSPPNTTVSSIGYNGANPTGASDLYYTITFAAPVTGLSTNNFTISTTGAAGGNISSIAGSGNTYTIDVGSIYGVGTLTLSLGNENGLTPGLDTGLPYSASTVTINSTAPPPGSLSISGMPIPLSTTSGTASASTNIEVSGSNLNGNVTVTVPPGFDVSADNSTWSGSGGSFAITPASGSISSIPAYIRLDAGDAPNQYSGAVVVTGGGASQAFLPLPTGLVLPSYTVTAITPAIAYSNGSIIQYTVTFNTQVMGLTPQSFLLATTGAVSGANVVSINGMGSSYTVTVITGTGDGTIGLNLFNSMGMMPVITNVPFTGGIATVDRTPPTATISAPSVASTGNSGSGSVSYTVTYADANFNTSSLTSSGITLNTTGSATGTVGVSGSGTSYTVTISGITGLGTLGISVGGGHASDLAGNIDSGAGPSAPFNVVPSSDATLSNLILSAGQVTPTFRPGTTSYARNVVNTITSVTVTPTTDVSSATVKVNGTTVASGTASGQIALTVGANVINAVVTAESGVTKTYTLTVIRDSSTNANLATLGQSISGLTPAFSSTTTGYTINASNATATMTLKPASSDANATIKVNGTAVTSGTMTAPIALAEGGQTVITTVVTAQNGTTTKTYTLTVNRAPSSIATLSNLQPNNGTLSPGFASGTMSYTASVANAVSTITVTPTATDASAAITVNGNPVTSGTASNPIPLAEGAQTVITTVVTSQDGVNTITYTSTVTRAASADASLSTLQISNGALSPAFASGTTSYAASVVNTVTAMTVTPSTDDPNATVTVNGIAVTSGSASQSLPLMVGTNSITVTVTAQDGVTMQTYTLVVTRPKSPNDNLSALKPGTGAISPTFSSATTSYTETVSNTVTSITITSTTAVSSAVVKVNGIAVTSGTASGPIALAIGANVITAVVTSESGAIKTYTLTVTRPSSTNDNLSTLGQSVSGLTPAFSSATTSYTLNAGNATATITLKPVSSDASATITVNGTAVTSGTTTAPIALAEGGQTVITTVVTAQDGVTTKTYILTVSRAPSSIATLSNLQPNNGTLSPVFATATTSYITSVANAASTLTVTPTATDASATITVNGTAVASGTASTPIPLAEGAQTVITTVVTSQDGTATKTYTLTVTRAPSSDASLSSIKLSTGTLSPAFASATTGYTASVANTVTTITITPTTTDANATIKVNGTAVTSGTASNAITLAEGVQTVITTVITAQDGSTTQTYTVTVTRSPSTNANLATLGQSISGLTPAFSSTTTSYTINASNATATMTLKPVSSDANATIKVNGTAITSGTITAPIALAVGSNTVTTVVTAQNGTTTKTYTLTVTRASGGADNYNPDISVTKPTETPQLVDDGIQVHQGLSPNGDGINDFLMIDNISQYPDNKLSIMNRNGQLIYEANGYDNSSKVFDGHSNKNRQMQLPGTYFYQLDYTVNGIAKHKTGFIILKY